MKPLDAVPRPSGLSRRAPAVAALILGALVIFVTFSRSRAPTAAPRSSPSPVSTASASPAPDSVVSSMRADLASAFDLVDRYDRTCPPQEGLQEESGVRARILGDAFFRNRTGELSLLFTALSRLGDLIDQGDEAGVDDPVWAQVDLLGYDIVEEAGRSNGFDSGSSLRRPLERVRGLVQRPGKGSWREYMRRSMLSQFEYFRTLSRPEVFRHVEDQIECFRWLETTEPAWRDGPSGRLVRWNLLARVLWTIETSRRMILRSEEDDEAFARLRQQLLGQGLRQLSLSADPLAGLTGAERTRAQVCLLGVASTGLTHLESSPEIGPLIARSWQGLDFHALAPRTRFELSPQILQIVELGGQRGRRDLPAGLLETARSIEERLAR